MKKIVENIETEKKIVKTRFITFWWCEFLVTYDKSKSRVTFYSLK